jgi:hypothetical protein
MIRYSFHRIQPTHPQKNHPTPLNPSHSFLHKDLVEIPKPNPVRRQALMAAVDGLDVDLVEGQIT